MDKSLKLKDRLIISNQFEILSRLAEDEEEKENFENLKKVFVSGYSRYYSLATEHFSEEIKDEECKFVIDVLDLYKDLYYSRENDDEIKNAIPERKVLFKGFDLNDSQEVKYFSFYKFLVQDLGRFVEIKEFMEAGKIEDFNSHGFGPSMDKLADMIYKWKQIKSAREFGGFEYLSLEEINEILKA